MNDLIFAPPPEELDFDLPSVRQITLELIQLFNDFNVDIRDVVELIRLDPMLTGRIIAYANSPLMMPINPITELDMAVTRSGFTEIKRIFYRTILRDAFSAVNDESDSIMSVIWMHSLATSLAMEKLRALYKDHLNLSSEESEAFSSIGILHSVGFVLLHHNFPDRFRHLFVDNAPRSMNTYLDQEREAFDGLDHCLAGKYVLDRWYFPSFAGNCILSLFDPQARGDLIGLMRLSSHLALRTGFSFYPDNPPDFWLQGLPEAWDLDAAMNLQSEIAREVSLLQNIMSTD